MTSQRSHWVMLSLGRDVCGMGFFGRGKGSEVQSGSVGQVYPRLKLAVGARHTEQARLVAFPPVASVLRVFLIRSIAQVGNSVVRLDAVDVVDNAVWCSPVNVEPCGPVRSDGFSQNRQNFVSCGSDVSCAASGLGQSTPVFKPRENARLRVVAQKLFQFLLGDYIFRFSHVIAPSQRCFGEGLAGAGNTFLPRFNIGRAA